MPEKEVTEWHLGNGYTQNERGHESSDSFGWDFKKQEFYTLREGNLSLWRKRSELQVPVLLAERFLLRCLAPDFNSKFLGSAWGGAEGEELFESEEGTLTAKVYTSGTYNHYSRTMEPRSYFSLYMEAGGGEKKSLSIATWLKNDFGKRIVKLTPDHVRARLRGTVIA